MCGVTTADTWDPMQLAKAGDRAEIALKELRRLVHGIRIASHAVERTWGITGAQLFVLRELSLEAGVSIRRLSERTMTDPSSVSVIIARLVERGLVTNVRDAADRRRRVLSLTKKGNQLLSRAPAPYQGRLIAALRELPPSRLAQLAATLSSVSDALGISHVGTPMFFEAEGRKERKTRVSRS